MNIFKKALAVVSLAFAFAPQVHASEVNIGGVVFDPDYNDGVENDFIGRFDFTQWFTTSPTTTRVLNNFESAASIGAVMSSLNGSSAASGFYLQGGGKLNQVNDSSNSFNTGFGPLGSFCPSCQLTYAFGGIGLNKNQTFDVSNAWAQIYVDNSTAYETPINSSADASTLLDGKVWLDFKVLSLGFLFGNVQNGLVSSELEVTGGLAAFNFVPATLSYSAGAFFPSLTSKYSQGGNGSILGNSVPEPGTIALLGFGLLGLALTRRRKV
jgi:hypothetical protein